MNYTNNATAMKKLLDFIKNFQKTEENQTYFFFIKEFINALIFLTEAIFSKSKLLNFHICRFMAEFYNLSNHEKIFMHKIYSSIHFFLGGGIMD